MFASAGVLGGESGGLSHFRTLRNGEAIEHGNTDVIRCQPGDIVEVRGPGAGGYGLPVERNPAAVLQDVRCGFVSVQVARDSYGVAIAEGEVDEAMTARLRAEMRSEVRQHFEHGLARTAFEQLWTPARYALLTEFLAGAPISWRHFLKQQVFDAVAADAQPTALEAVAADTQTAALEAVVVDTQSAALEAASANAQPAALEAQMQAIFQNLQQRYPAMMNRSH